MALLNWNTDEKLKKIEAELREAMKDTEFQIGSPVAVAAVALSVIELIHALREEPGPVINHNF